MGECNSPLRVVYYLVFCVSPVLLCSFMAENVVLRNGRESVGGVRGVGGVGSWFVWEV
ncbi:MAG: hypothetical protein F6K40_28030 [Okeania sp. SIO3I5]|uniref:hypothetical protein n=1 Tax=Okeania sp. SIO3I5 TaxID=2607805 RepID=UPI0013BC7795|nr:hypothetical protein [Okeania sp. SIO3I5]NEQ39890.1 hypothetical protein [Okeania sp. SIO3I5]